MKVITDYVITTPKPLWGTGREAPAHLCLAAQFTVTPTAEQGNVFLIQAGLSERQQIWIGREGSAWNSLSPSLSAKEPPDPCWSGLVFKYGHLKSLPFQGVSPRVSFTWHVHLHEYHQLFIDCFSFWSFKFLLCMIWKHILCFQGDWGVFYGHCGLCSSYVIVYRI